MITLGIGVMSKKLMILSLMVPTLFACTSTDNKQKTQLVYIDKGTIQCESKGKTTQQTAAILEQSGIQVTESQCANLTNMMVATMCGAPGTSINLHQIASDDVGKAEKLGFSPVSRLQQDNSSGYEIVPCT